MIQLPSAASNLPFCRTWEASAFSLLAVRIELVRASSHLLHRTLSPLATLALHRHRTARIAGDTCLANSTDVRRYICVVGKQSVGQSVGQSSTAQLQPRGRSLQGTSVNLIGPFLKFLVANFKFSHAQDGGEVGGFRGAADHRHWQLRNLQEGPPESRWKGMFILETVFRTGQGLGARLKGVDAHVVNTV